MRIIIDGAGEVGIHLAKMLSKENHSITLIGEQEEVMVNLNANYDLMTMIGDPCSISTLKDAGCASADLFIGVTPEESRNIVAGYIAHNLGCKKVVIRVESPEYMKEEHRHYFQDLGIDSVICPELLAAKEIVETVDRPWIRQFHSFGNGELCLICVKIRESAPIINQKLMNLFKPEDVCRIAAIKRGNKTIIPSGHDTILPDDVVYFITTPEDMEKVRILAGKPLEKVQDVMIMGGSRIAILAADKLSKTLNVKIIEQSRKRSEFIKERLGSKVMVIQGDGRDMDLLNDEGIERMEAYIALTGSDETNIFSCLAAKRFNVPRSIAEVEQLDYIPLADNLDIGIVINKKLIAASHIYQMMLDADVTNMKCLTFANADVAEFIVKENSKITKKLVKDLHLPEDVSLGGLIRDGKGIIIYGNTQIQAGDRVVIFCLSSQIQKVEKYFR